MIETGSKDHIRKIFTYWIILSAIHMIIRLRSSLLACFVWFKKLKNDSSIKKENFLAVAERYLEEIGSEALAKLIADKPECNNSSPVLVEIEVKKCTAKSDATESNQDGNTEDNVLQIEKKTSSSIQANKTALQAGVEVIKLPVSSSMQKHQTRWNCTMCQVTTSSELTLQSHLRGKRHREESKLWCNFCNLRCSGEIDMIAHLKGRKHLEKLQETFADGSTEDNVLQIEKKTSSSIQANKTALQAGVEVIKLPDSSSIQKHQTRWYCTMCEVTTSSELTLQSHLRGKRHREESKLWCNFCNLRCSGEIDIIAHLKGRKHLEKLQETSATGTWANDHGKLH